MCSATGVRQVLLPEFLLRPGLCAVNGCAQPHNGSGQGRCQIHETSHFIKCYEQRGEEVDTAMTNSVNIERWTRELRDRSRLDHIESGPVKYAPKEQSIRARTHAPSKYSHYQVLGGGYLGQYLRGLLQVAKHRSQNQARNHKEL